MLLDLTPIAPPPEWVTPACIGVFVALCLLSLWLGPGEGVGRP